MSLEHTEAECAAVAKARRVTLESMQAKIAFKAVFTGDQLPVHFGQLGSMPECLSHLTVCILVMQNGFMIIGKSAPAIPENFNAELGAKLAYEDAIRQLWPLEGYLLREEANATKEELI